MRAAASADADGHQPVALQQGDERPEVDRRVERLEARHVDHHSVAVEEVGDVTEAGGKVTLEGVQVRRLEEQRDQRQVRALDFEAGSGSARDGDGLVLVVVCALLPGQTFAFLLPVHAVRRSGLIETAAL
jgi:hypothetical protein